MTSEDWADPELRLLAAEMRMASGTPDYAALPGAVFVVFNAGPQTSVRLPDTNGDGPWRRRLDSARDDEPDEQAGGVETIAENSVAAFVLAPPRTAAG